MTLFKIHNTGEFTAYFLIDHNNEIHRMNAPSVVDFFTDNYDDIFESDLTTYSLSKTILKKKNFRLFVELFSKNFPYKTNKIKQEALDELLEVIYNLGKTSES